MKLMRNTTADGQCKYAAIRMDKVAQLTSPRDRAAANRAFVALCELGVMENPRPGDPEEFFLIKLKDQNAEEALYAYAASASSTDPELSRDVHALAARSGVSHPLCKAPD